MNNDFGFFDYFAGSSDFPITLTILVVAVVFVFVGAVEIVEKVF